MCYNDVALFTVLDIPSHPLVPPDMPYIAPLLLSVLVHVIVSLWAIVTSILSAWKRHRVELASATYPAYDEPPPVVQPRRSSRPYTDHKSYSSPPSPKSIHKFSALGSDTDSDCGEPLYFKTSTYPMLKQTRPIPFKRTLSAHSPIELGLVFEKSPSDSFPPSPSMSARSDSLPPSPGMPAFLSLNEGSEYGDDDEVNSVTGSLKEDPKLGLRNVHARYTIASAAEIAQAERSQGRRILCFLSVLRACVAAPLVWFELSSEGVTVSGKHGLFQDSRLITACSFSDGPMLQDRPRSRHPRPDLLDTPRAGPAVLRRHVAHLYPPYHL